MGIRNPLSIDASTPETMSLVGTGVQVIETWFPIFLAKSPTPAGIWEAAPRMLQRQTAEAGKERGRGGICAVPGGETQIKGPVRSLHEDRDRILEGAIKPVRCQQQTRDGRVRGRRDNVHSAERRAAALPRLLRTRSPEGSSVVRYDGRRKFSSRSQWLCWAGVKEPWTDLAE